MRPRAESLCVSGGKMTAKRKLPRRRRSRTLGFGQRTLDSGVVLDRCDDFEGFLFLQRRGDRSGDRILGFADDGERDAGRAGAAAAHAEDFAEKVDEDDRNEKGERDRGSVFREAAEFVADENENGAHGRFACSGIAQGLAGEVKEDALQTRPRDVDGTIGQPQFFHGGEKFREPKFRART